MTAAMSPPLIFMRAPVSQDDLSNFSREISRTLTLGVQTRNVEWIPNLLDILLVTARDPNLSSIHTTTAYNALCAMIESCLKCSDDNVCQIVLASTFCETIFKLYTDQYDSAKPKASSQLLSTILKVIAACSSPDATDSSLQRCALRLMAIVFQNNDASKVKGALHALIHFMTRNVISLGELLRMFKDVVLLDSFTLQSADTFDTIDVFQKFFGRILGWVTFVDASATVGRLCAAIIQKSQVELPGLYSSFVPPWSLPLVDSMHNNPAYSREFQQSVLPKIFACSVQDFWKFLVHLDIDRYVNGARNISTSRVSPNGQSINEQTIFAALQIGKDIGFVEETDVNMDANIVMVGNIVVIRTTALSVLLNASSNNIRLAAMTLLISSPHMTRPLEGNAISIIRKNISHLLAEVDANFRGEVLSLIQSFIYRIRAIIASLSRLVDTNKTSDVLLTTGQNASNSLKAHDGFIKWFIEFLFSELHPSASYQQRISALKCLNLLVQSGIDPRVSAVYLSKQAKRLPTWHVHHRIIGESTIRLVVDLLLDPFEDIRHEASDILRRTVLPETVIDRTTTSATVNLDAIIGKGSEIVKYSGRVDFADGVARMYGLKARTILGNDAEPLSSDLPNHSSGLAILHSLMNAAEMSVLATKQGLGIAVEQHPIHGIFTAMRCVLETLLSSHEFAIPNNDLEIQLSKIFDCVKSIWEIVKSYLCNDAPEGYMPDGLDMEIELTAKDVSSYAWRSIRESSILLRSLVTDSATSRWFRGSDVLQSHLKGVGDFCFGQLADLRHRGAFATVAQTFEATCAQCGHSDSCELLLTDWYQRCMTIINDKASTITRRSAGIPSLITGVIAADETGRLFQLAVSDLISIVSQNSQMISTQQNQALPQVHALNALKALFVHAKLAQHSERHIVPVMQIAAQCLTSRVWAIRNCGLMLFRALLDRLLGSSDKDEPNQNSGVMFRFSYDAYPGLINLVMDLLEAAQEAIQDVPPAETLGEDPGIVAEAIFPILDLIRRAPPPEQYKRNIQALLLQAAGNRHWHIRKLAAESWAATVLDQGFLKSAQTLFPGAELNANMLHGRLLCLLALNRSMFRSKSSVGGVTASIQVVAERNQISDSRLDLIVEAFSIITSLTKKLDIEHVSEVVFATYVQILNEFAVYLLSDYINEVYTSDTRIDGLLLELIRVSISLHDRASNGYLAQQALQLNLLLTYLLTTYLQTSTDTDLPISPSDMALLLKDNSGDYPHVATSLEKLATVLENASALFSDNFMHLIVQFLVESNSTQLQQVCENLIAQWTIDPNTRGRVCWTFIEPLVKYFKGLNMIARFTDVQSPSSEYNAIRIWGFCMHAKWAAVHQVGEGLVRETRAWLSVLRANSTDESSFDDRSAALGSTLVFLTRHDAFENMTEELQVQLAILVYDFLNDDDDSIRTDAAEAARMIYGAAMTKPAFSEARVPAIAGQMLCSHLVKYFAQSPYLLQSAIWGVIGSANKHSATYTSVEATLKQLLDRRTKLFDEEKQNLYRDDVREAKIWTAVLMRLTLSSKSLPISNDFVSWVVDGLQFLIDYTAKHEDGPLGWTSRSDVFSTGMRVIFGTRVVLNWRSKYKGINVRGSVLRRKIQELVEVGERRGLHNLWLREMRSILEESVRLRLQRVGGALGFVLSSHGGS